MEQGLRDCCRSIRIGKILVESDADTHEARVVYARFPEDISSRHVSKCLKNFYDTEFNRFYKDFETSGVALKSGTEQKYI